MIKNLVSAFEEQVEKTPNQVAIEFGEESLTYYELNQKSNAVAFHLVNTYDVKCGDVIPLLLSRSEKIIVAMLGVLKAGACYTALSKDYPESRVSFVLEQTEAKLLIDDDFFSQKFEKHSDNLNISINQDDVSYIVYTSGTTGNPKGVLHTHKGVLNHIQSYYNYLNFDTSMSYNMLFLVNYVFSVATTQIYSALFYGHKLVISEPDCLENIQKFTDYINEKEINYFQCTPSLADSLNYREIEHIRIVAVSGEKISKSLFYNTHSNSVKLINVYGQSEFHAGTAKIVDSVNDIQNIGSNLDNMTAYVLDDNLRKVGIGQIGEMYMAGDQLSLGYLKLKDETKKHFISNPFGKGILCRTGDLVKNLNNREFEFVGRNDFQLNINGIRTEPGEIETQIANIPEVQKTVVVGYNNQFIIAYYVSKQKLEEEYIKSCIIKKIPDYMQPHIYYWLEQFPLNANGKLDRKKLPKVSFKTEKYVAPITNIEKIIIESVENILGIENVSILDNFFHLGGNSLKAMKLSNIIFNKTKKKLTAKDIFASQQIKDLINLIEIHDEMVEMPLVSAPRKNAYSMSPVQKRMYTIYELNSKDISYNEQTIIDFSGKVNAQKMQKALEEMIIRHESLRTKFSNRNGQYIQEVMPEGQLDFQTLPYTNNFSDFVKPMNLENGQTMKVILLRQEQKDSLFIDKHHIITDGTSEKIFYNELERLYRGDKLENSNLHYKDYSFWFEQLELNNEKKWWNNYLSGYQRLELATDHKEVGKHQPIGKTLKVPLNSKLVQKIHALSKKKQVSEYVILFATISLLLSKIYNSDDFILGTVSSGRVHEATDKMLGMFVNTLPIRVQPNSKLKVSEFLDQVNEDVLSALSNQNYQFDELIKDLDARNNIGNPFFNCMYVYQNIEKNEYFDGNAKKHPFKTSAPKFNLTFEIEESELGMELFLNYDDSLFEMQTIEQLAKRFIITTENFINVFEGKLSEISVISNEEKAELLETIDIPVYENVIDLFEKQVKLRPDDLAVRFENVTLSYSELNDEVNKVANFLIEEVKVQPEQKIPLLLNRTHKMVIAILAILKAGAAYIPISLKYPQERINYIINVCDSDLLIDDNFMEQIFPAKVNNPRKYIKSDQLAYIIFTSGTSGKPKGVMVKHENLSNYVVQVAKVEKSGMKPGMVNGAFFEYVFDASIHDLIRPFTMGESIVILDTDLLHDINLFIQTLIRYKINTIGMTPSLAVKLDLKTVPTMQVIHCGGEAITQEVIGKYADSSIQLNNCYGPTETTVLCFVNNDVSDLSIGEPIGGVNPYVLDENYQLLPKGAIGNLYIGGNQVSQGYINQLEETTKRYIENPFGKGLLYDTGDLVRVLNNGSYEYLGRKDLQVKIRGFRIELNEIEKKLQEIEGIDQVKVIVKNENLLTYYIAQNEFDWEFLYDKLSKSLPEYMIPTFYMRLKEFPLTINGKLNVRALPEVIYRDKYDEPETSREKEIEAAFCQVLGLNKVSVTSNFFRLGGNSIMAISLAKLINLPVKDIFERKTIQNLAKVDEQISYVEKQIFTSVQEQSLSYAQERLYFIDRLEDGTQAYNIPILVTLSKNVNYKKLEAAIQKVIERHEILRTIIVDFHQELSDKKLEITHDEIDLNEFFSYSFNIEKEIPILVNIFKNTMAINIHHIAFDGWSTNILLEEIASIYEGESLPLVEIQYKDFAKWQSKVQDKNYLNEQEKYWTDKLKGYEILDFPTDFSRPQQFNYEGQELNYELDTSLIQGLNKVAKEYNTSLYCVTLSAFMLLLSTYSNQKDITLGTPIANRHIRGTEKMIGLFVNTLALRSQINPNESFAALLEANSNQMIKAQKYQDLPFERLVNALKVEKDLSRNPIFQIMFGFQDIESIEDNDLFASVNKDLYLNSTKFDISVMHRENIINFTFATKLFKKETIQGIAETYEKILKQIAIEPEIIISQIELNDSNGNSQKGNYPNLPIHKLFENVAATYPKNAAIVFEGKTLTYETLNQKANQFAHTLIDEYDIKPKMHIPILMERSERYAIAILGILKTGASYVPMSLEYPQERINYIIEKVNAPLTITENFIIKSKNINNPNISISENDLAYIIFTSGTTGHPKGVMIEHRSVVNTIYNQIEIYNITENTRAIHFADFVFDASVFELFYALLAGAASYLLSEEERTDFYLLKQVITENQITLATLPPAILNNEYLLPLKTLIVAGESTPQEIYQAYTANKTIMVNAYGPTEITICATVKFYNQNMNSNNIGTALKNIVTYVLDSENRQVPFNAVGELCIGGIGVARGYIGDDEKTNKSFISHPKYGRLYKTGDLVKRLQSGDLIYIGRNDFQVKVHGFRIELGEIEAKLLEQKSISQCIALVNNDNIVAYYTGKLQYSLENMLPKYMVPKHYLQIDKIPLTINGKIDFRKLPVPVIEHDEYIEPSTKRENEISKAFCELLSLERVSVLDDFYTLGGNSILALKLANKINLQVKQIFEAKDIRKLAKLKPRTLKLTKVNFENAEEQVLSFAQERLWFIDQFETNLNAYNVPLVLQLANGISLIRIEKSIMKLVYRHEILRTVIKGEYQEVLSENLQITHNPININDFINTPFDLENEIPIRVNIYDSQLIMSIHHIAFDGWSTELLLKELNKLYNGEQLPILNVQYKDFSHWQRNYLSKEKLKLQTNYWKETLDSYEPINLPIDFERPKEFTYSGSDICIDFKDEWKDSLEKLARKHHTSLYTVMLSILDIMLMNFCYQQDIIVGTPFANRHVEGTEDLIGFFINTLPIRTLLDEELSFTKLLQKNHKSVLNAQNNQDIPFEQVVKALNDPQDISRNPIFQVLFSVQNFSMDTLTNNNLFAGCNANISNYSAKYDLSILVENGFINFNYCTDLFKKSTVQSMAKAYTTILEAIVVNDNESIGEIIVSDKFVQGEVRDYLEVTVVDLFNKQVARTPEQVAIEYRDTRLTYDEFNRLTNRFANYLLAHGVKPGDKVPLILERSEKMAIAIWGVLKAGCAYVPISPEFPDERKKYIINQIDSKLVIDESFAGYNEGNEQNLSVRPSIDDLAYIIFTSGTTGKPKGVMIEHGGLSNRVQWMNDRYPIRNTDKVYQKTNFVFDVSVWEQVWALLTGGRIVYAIENGHKDPIYLLTEIKEKDITIVHFVPSMLDVFLDTLEIYQKESNSSDIDISSLRHVFCSGEALNINSVRRFKKFIPNAEIHNLYGPTEASIDVTSFDYISSSIEKVLIGKPVSNTLCYVLSKSNHLLPTSAIGELAIGGVQVAKGYINQPELTAEKFPTHSKLGRIYKTGDLVRLLDTGEIEYLGRNDFQVKIHGLRIELGEIESKLSDIDGVLKGIVLKVKERLIAYYLGDRPIREEFLKKKLEERLPEYMIPNKFVFMKNFPLTINGKLDRRAFPVPTMKTENFVQPENETEIKIQEIVSEILELKSNNVNVLESFFHLGGDSIKAMQLSNRIKQKLDQTITIKQIFEAKNIRNIALLIGKTKEIEIINEQGELTGEVKLLPIQEWFFEEYNSSYFNQAFAISLPKDIDLSRLKKSLINLVNYHDAFRISFKEKRQYYTSKIEEVELNFAETHEEFSRIQNSFSLDNKLYRFVIKRSENILAIICHHLIIDSVSWKIIASDLQNFYEKNEFHKKRTSYRQWSEEIHKGITNFISEDISDCDYLFELSDEYKEVYISIDSEFTNKLLTQVNQVYNTQVNDVLLTAFARALKSIHNQKTSYIKLESHGRAELSENINIKQTIGWFTTIYPQIISTDIVETKNYTNTVSDYGIGYGVKYGIHSKDLPKVMFNYLGQMNSDTIEDWSIVHSDLGETTNVNFTDFLTVNGGILNKELTFELSGKLNGIEKLAKLYQMELENIITELSSYNRTFLTSDDIDQIITQQQLDVLQKNQELGNLFPANTLQKGFVYHALNNDTNDDAYICSFIFDYEQTINVENYRKAWSIAQSKYPSLRLSLNTDYEEILQVIHKVGKLDFEILENISVDEVVNLERKVAFDLDAGSLFRIRLIRHNRSRYTCVLTNHHAILDGWSNPILLNFVHGIYARLCKGEQIYINEDKAYIKSQQYLEQTKNNSDNYWKKHLGEVSHPDLGGLFKKEKRTTKLENLNRIEDPKDKVYEIQGENYAKLVDFAKNKDVTINIIAQYAWHKLLSVYGGVNETTVGVVNAGRNIPVEDIEESVGLYIRTLPIQFKHENDSILTQLLHLQDINNECMMNNNINLASLQTNGTRLFDTLFIYENYPLSEESNKEQLKITSFTGQEKLDYPLTIVLYESNNSLSFRMKYAGELFAEETIDQMFNFMNYLIDQMVEGIEELNYVSSIPDFGVSKYPNTTIVEEFEKQVEFHPNEIALKFAEINYSFAELNSRANQLAHTLVENFNIKRGDCISLLLSKSEKMIVAILGVLKAGAVYVPISPTFPQERITYIKEQVKSKLLIDETFMNQEFSNQITNINISVQADDLAYIIFTSGTTGHPKGVMVEHRNFICYLENIITSIQRTGTEEIEFACIAEYVFDIFGTEVFGQLLRGKPVNLFTGTPEEFPNFMKNHYVTTLQSTPGKISYLFQDNDKEILSTALTTILVGGEKMNDSFAKRFKNINLINIYGPTEGTVWTSLKKLDDNYSNIGKAFRNYSHFILDDKMRLLPKGAIGELYVGGPQLSRGYYGQNALTESTFVKNPYNKFEITEYNRIYKTGDIVRELPNDEFELIGRNDFQVKIRGFRIELGEIENAMLKVNGIKQVLALALGGEGEKYLGIYYQSDNEIPRFKIEEVLSLYLTDYMMPSGYQHVQEFPLTINGKIDRRKLPIISYKNDIEYEAPNNEVEQLVLQTMCNVLEINSNEVSVLESFFTIGGDSIKVIKLLSLLKKKFSKKITIKEIFDVKTTRGIAQVLQNKVNQDDFNRLIVSKQEFLNCKEQKLSFAQQKYTKLPLNSYSNVKMFFRLKKGIDVNRLKQAVISVVNRHEILRTRLCDGYQIVEDTPLVVTSNNVNRVDYFSYTFNLEKEIPIRVNIFNGEFICVIDHVAFDGWSTSLFLEDIENFYFDNPLPKLLYQYKDFAKCQYNFLSGDKKEQQVDYWQKEFENFKGVNLSKNKLIRGDTKKGGDLYLHLNDDFYEKMIYIIKDRGLTLHNVLLSTYYLTLTKVSQQKNISIAIPTVNRDIPGIENLVGLFINQFLITMTIDENQTFVMFIEKLKEKIIAAQNNQDVPLEQIIEEIGIKLKGNTFYFGIQGFKGEALKRSKIFEEAPEINQISEKDAFSDLTIFVWGQNINFNYSKALFQVENIQDFADTYETILKKLIYNIDIKIKELI